MLAALSYSLPNSFLISRASSCLIQPISSYPKLLLKVVWSCYGYLYLTLGQWCLFSCIICASWLASTDFVNPLCLSHLHLRLQLLSLVNQSTMVDIELTLGVGPSLDHPTLPVDRIAALASNFLCCLKHFLLKNNGPSHSPSSNVSAIFLPQVGCIMLLQLGSWHFSKFSSTFRHFARSLHVMFIFLPLLHGFGFGWDENSKA